ncbi:MAG: NADH-quinone oxidoreductase subunit NuoG [Actinobacteria bacterium]|nr:NADH-quinone oxidoreductase subunit NuoG [Actinomycetota bacterium]
MTQNGGAPKDTQVGLTLNGRELKVEKDRLLIDVAEEVGIFVPRFCYHPGMKSVAVCRMCLVKVEGSPKLLPACATPVTDGMVVDTVDETAVDAQRGMLEFLLINHPLDCPICDRAGECPLQDQTYAHGPGSTRYVEPKRTYEKALEISELVVLDRERCVLCWRCVRFADEIAGDRFIQLVDRGPGTQILTFSDEPFDSYFSGNTIQICPVGALTSKPYRFVSRPWDLQTAPSVCTYCSVGCPLTNESRDEKIVRCQALPNENVNDFWLCDKGRYGYHHVESAERLGSPLVRSGKEFEPASWGAAVDKIVSAIKDKRRIGVIAGGHLTTEDAYAIGKLAKKVLETKDVDSRIQDAGAPYERALALGGIAGSTATLNDVEGAPEILWVGPDPKETLPVLYLRLRKAVNDGGARLTVVSPRATSLDVIAAKVVRCEAGGEGRALREIDDLGDDAVVCWGQSSPGRDETDAFDAAVAASQASGGKLLVCVPHAGSQGMLDMGVHPGLDAGYVEVAEPGRDTRAILEAAAAGELDALFLFGADPIADFPDAGLARRALEKGIFTVAVELFPTQSAMRADVVLPSAAYAEREGTFTNLERRVQKLERLVAPPGTAQEPWKTCAAIAGALGDAWGWARCDDVWDDIRRNVPTHKDLDLALLTQEAPAHAPFYESAFGDVQTHTMDPPALTVAGPGGQYPKGYRSGAPFQTGQNWPLSWELRAFEAKQRPGVIPHPNGSANGHGAAPAGAPDAPDAAPRAAEGGDDFVLLSGRLIYDEGSMVSRSKALGNIASGGYAELNPGDAADLEVSAGDRVVLRGAGAEVTLPVRIGDIAKGAVYVPYDQRDVKANTLMSGVDSRVGVAKA